VTRLLRPLTLLLALVLLAPAAALAQAPAPTMLDGSPLNVWTTQGGNVQVALDGAPGEFYYAGTATDPNPTGNAGFSIVIDPQGSAEPYGAYIGGGALPIPDSGPTLAPGSPATLTTKWTVKDFNGNPLFELTQVLAYTNGSRQVEATYTIKNLRDSPLPFRALWAADLSIRGTDHGVAFLNGSPPNRFMGGLNQEAGAAGGFVEETPWSAFESNALGAVVGRGYAYNENPGFDGSLSADDQDNAAGVEWDDHYSGGLRTGETATYRVGLRFVDTLGISPLSATHETGDEHVTNVTTAALDGRPVPGQRIVWESSGANPATGNVTTDKDGKAQFSYVGGNVGLDNLRVFADENKNGQADTGEPQSSTTVTWTGTLPAPIIGTNVNVRPESGTVLVQLPPGTSAGKAKAIGVAPAAAKKFVPLRAGLQIPVGSLLDTRRGSVRLLSAGLPTPNGSAFQGASFRGAQFQVRQGHSNPLTELIARGGGLNKCGTKVPRGGAAKLVASAVRARTLFGRGKGRFRTRGRNSSATVRGTQWVQKDTCSGTLTVVKAGTVVVRDFAKKRNIVVKKGKRYLARPPRIRLKP
jgi:hypothetical protein